MRGRIALQKHFVQNSQELRRVSHKLWECVRVLASLSVAPDIILCAAIGYSKLFYRSNAKNSFDGLRRETAAGLRIPSAALAAMALSSAWPTFQCAPSSGTQLRPLDSGFRHRSSRHATNPARDSDAGA